MEFESKIESVSVPVESSALIIVDMQNDFVHPNGKLYSPNTKNIIQPIEKLLKRARDSGSRIIFTQDTHFPDDPIEFPIWGEHVVKGSWGWQIIEELKPLENEITIEKLRYDAFFGTPIEHILRIYNIKQLIIVGTVANICVLHTVSTARLHNFDVIVPIDAISALTDFDYNLSLRQMDFLYKVKLTKESLINFIESEL
ncbi:MAG TPA: isochorismatase family cysteine hydrolase [Candidatus Hydrogenedens sp.]|nr:isochorismatase family cysteine hydrolase [Candidatus Hydrogenedens sp.]